MQSKPSQKGRTGSERTKKSAKRGDTALSGILLVDKPCGMTSHDLVRRLRRFSGEGRIGHCGTLDPDASGLMIMLIGHAATLSNDFIVEEKSYRAAVTFGAATTTDDAQGQITASSDVPLEVFGEGHARALLTRFLGESDQIPPDFSALKQGGKVAHREARKGSPLTFEPRSIYVHSAELVSIDTASQSWIVDFKVSKGTYIRALARDIGKVAGTHAHLSALRRLSSGDFTLADACSIDDIEAVCADDPLAIADLFVPRETLLRSLPTKRLTAASVAGRRVGPSLVTIGVFDGVHAGHQALLATLVKRAKEQGMLATVLTFDAHPRGVVRPLEEPVALMTLPEKITALKACGVDEVIVLPFNHKMSQQSAKDFLTLTLPTLVQAQEIVVGDNFRFGKGAETGPRQIEEILSAASSQISLSLVELETCSDGLPYSSTRLRKKTAQTTE